MHRDQARSTIAKLASDYAAGRSVFSDPKKYDEAKVRAGFVDPFFEALGWEVKAGQRRIGRDREVVVEDRAGKGNRDRPDYGFYISGELKFYVEAKQPSKSLSKDGNAAFQLKSYVWSKRAALGILTNFEEFYAFHGAFKPQLNKPGYGQISSLTMTCDQYEARFDALYDTFSRDAVESGSIERLVASELASGVRNRHKIERDLFKARGAKPVDVDFLESLESWRESLAREFARRNNFEDGQEITEVVQRFLDRLVFVRVAEDRRIEHTNTLAKTLAVWREQKKKPLYGYLIELFHRLESQFNGGLFSPHSLSDDARFDDDKILIDIIAKLYPPEGQYKFDVMPVELLGAVYERFLGKVVRVTEGGHRAKVEDKPEIRHSNGVYYTPSYVVSSIVEKTVGPILKDATSEAALRIRILDPACGSGSFLLGAFQFLMDWHLKYYSNSKDPAKSFPGACYLDADGSLRLTFKRKREILTQCLYGVDIDPQAAEVAQMSLYLKLLEDEAEETIAFQRSLEMWKADKYLPNLSRNIVCGNSLLKTSDVTGDVSTQDYRRLNPFDWNAPVGGFGSIMNDGGFDAIVGNPPYVRVQELSKWAPIEVEIYRNVFESAKEGNFDIYVAFVEKSLSLLKDGGRLGLIIPTKWWQSTYGRPLRSMLEEGRNCLEFIDFGDEQVFDGATTYTAISLFSKSKTLKVKYRRTSPDELAKFGQKARDLYAQDVAWKSLESGPWYPGVRGELRPLFDRLRSEGPFLGDESICSRVFQGLKTGADPVYVLDSLKVDGKFTIASSKALRGESVRIETDVLHPLVKGKQMKRFAPLSPSKVILFPYSVDENGARLIDEAVFAETAPSAWEYLGRNKRLLDARENGRWRGDSWYQYSRNQALDVVSLPKILTADLADRMSFSLDEKGSYFLLGGAAGGYGLLPSSKNDVAPLMALLNSTLLEWMLRPPGFSSPFRGGWFSCEARFINLLPIRLPSSKKDLNELANLSRRATTAVERVRSSRSDMDRTIAERQLEAVESEIDDRVFLLYGVDPTQQRLVRESVSELRQFGHSDGVGTGEDDN